MSSRRTFVVSIATAALLAGVAAHAAAQCSITAPSRMCPGDSVQLCVVGSTTVEWDIDDTTQATLPCITVTMPGTYGVRTYNATIGMWVLCQVTIAETPEDSCGAPPPPPAGSDSTNCPRSAAFWERQFQRGRSATFDRATLTALGTCVDGRAASLAWSDAYTGLRGALDPRGHDAWRAGAVRQFAAVMANLCARDAALVAGGVRIGLDPAATFQHGHTSSTVAQWAQAADAQLAQLAGARVRDRSAHEAYRRLVIEGWQLAHGIGTPRVCRAPAAMTSAGLAAALPGAEPALDTEDLSLEATLSTIDAEATLAEAPAPSPNPFRDATRLAFAVPAGGGEGEVAVFDVSGRRVATLARGPFAEGALALTWDGRDAAGARVRAGMYFVRAHIAGAEWTRSVLRVE